MLRIGIPNRSSALHLPAIVALIKSGIILPEHYHAAKLRYSSEGVDVVLMRCDQLCQLYAASQLDVIFTGGDYFAEFSPNAVGGVMKWDIVNCYFALLGRDFSIEQKMIYTKFPRIAKNSLDLADEENLIVVSGSCESYVMAFNQLCFDVVCVKSTINANHLSVIGEFTHFTPIWCGLRDECCVSRGIIAVIVDRKLKGELKNYYDAFYRCRDENTKSSIINMLR